MLGSATGSRNRGDFCIQGMHPLVGKAPGEARKQPHHRILVGLEKHSERNTGLIKDD